MMSYAFRILSPFGSMRPSYFYSKSKSFVFATENSIG